MHLHARQRYRAAHRQRHLGGHRRLRQAQPLDRQYRKLVGSTVEVLLTSGIKVLAKLDAADDQGITLSYEEKQAVEGKKRKQLVTVTRRYGFSEIKSAREWLDFK